jgi:hypothetical protein
VAVLSDLLSRVRLELGDNATQFTTNLTGTGTTKDFYLEVKPVDATFLSVTVNGVAQANPANLLLKKTLECFISTQPQQLRRVLAAELELVALL